MYLNFVASGATKSPFVRPETVSGLRQSRGFKRKSSTIPGPSEASQNDLWCKIWFSFYYTRRKRKVSAFYIRWKGENALLSSKYAFSAMVFFTYRSNLFFFFSVHLMTLTNVRSSWNLEGPWGWPGGAQSGRNGTRLGKNVGKIGAQWGPGVRLKI